MNKNNKNSTNFPSLEELKKFFEDKLYIEIIPEKESFCGIIVNVLGERENHKFVLYDLKRNRYIDVYRTDGVIITLMKNNEAHISGFKIEIHG